MQRYNHFSHLMPVFLHILQKMKHVVHFLRAIVSLYLILGYKYPLRRINGTYAKRSRTQTNTAEKLLAETAQTQWN